MPTFTQKPTYDELRALPTEKWNGPLLDELIGFNYDEGLHLELKEGDWLDHPKPGEDRNAELRRYVGGFANADGGILVVGISERPTSGARRNVNRASASAPIREFDGGGSLETWAKNNLQRGAVFPALDPFPRIAPFEYGDGHALVLVVEPARSPLVSVRAYDQNVFPARVLDSTVDLDMWAVQAILLGTRSRPDIDLTATAKVERPSGRADIVIRLELTLTNVGLIEMADPSWSFLSTIRTDNNSFHQGSDITPSHAVLRDVRVPADTRLFQRAMTQATTMPSLRPYADARLVITMPIGIAPTIGDATFAFAVSARNVLPMWWTIRMKWHGTVPIPIAPEIARADPPVLVRA
jgi:hypothetical protein